MNTRGVSTQQPYESAPKDGPAGRDADATESILGKDAFLRLLTTQLRYQDPMNPVDDQQFLAQMAQFTALEQIQNLNTTMEQFIEQEQYNRLFSDATHLMGRSVEVTGPSGEIYAGTVDGVRVVDGLPRLLIGDTLFNVRDVVQIKTDVI